MSLWPRRAALVGLALGLLCCRESGVPPDKLHYLGTWRGPGTLLEIRGDGRVEYTRTRAHVQRQILGAIHSFDGDDFIIGWPWWGTRIRVNRPPYLVDGRWRILVNDVELTRVGRPGYGIAI